MPGAFWPVDAAFTVQVVVITRPGKYLGLNCCCLKKSSLFQHGQADLLQDSPGDFNTSSRHLQPPGRSPRGSALLPGGFRSPLSALTSRLQPEYLFFLNGNPPLDLILKESTQRIRTSRSGLQIVGGPKRKLL